MKQLLTLFLFLLVSKMYCQEKTNLIGKWQAVIVESKDFYLNAKTDSISLSEKRQKLYPNKIAKQDEFAHLRSNYSKNTFIFTEKEEFYFYLTDRLIAPIFKGSYSVEAPDKIQLDIVNRANISLKKQANFYFENNLLYLTMYLETNSPIKYILERVKE